MLNFSQFIPILLLAPLAGGASDRWNRRQLLLVTQSVAVVLSGGLGLLADLDLAPTCAGWIALRARTRGWGAAPAELPPETA